MLEERALVGSQSHPHLEDGTTYHPLWPTNVYGRQNHLRVVAGRFVTFGIATPHEQFEPLGLGFSLLASRDRMALV